MTKKFYTVIGEVTPGWKTFEYDISASSSEEAIWLFGADFEQGGRANGFHAQNIEVREQISGR